MKKILSLLLLLVFAVSGKADNATAIKLLLEDGSSQVFQLDDNPKAFFQGEALVIASKKQEIRVSLDKGAVAQVMYVSASDGIREMSDGHQSVFRVSDDGLNASGLKPGSMVYVYDISGAVVAKAIAGKDGSLTVPLSGKGVFVVKTAVSSIKIKK